MFDDSLVIDLLEKQAELNPENVALKFEDREWSFYSLNASANSIGRWLIDQGIQSQDRILVYSSNSDWVVILLFGILKAGAIFVPINPLISEAGLAYICRDSQPSIVITECILYPKVISQISVDQNLKILLLPSKDKIFNVEKRSNTFCLEPIFSVFDNKNLDVKITSSDIALIIYTSGSTGDPKGVIEHHHSILFVTNAINQVIGNTKEDKILCGLPLSFDYGLYQIFLAFQAGAQIIISDFSFPFAIPGLLVRNGITGLPGVPSLFSILIRSRLLERISLPNLRYITSTGDVFPVEVIEKLQKNLPHTIIFPMYGLTECKRVSILPSEFLNERLGSVGLPLPGTKVSVIDDAGEELPRGSTGELIIRGPHLMGGYWNDPEETRKRYRKIKNETVLFTNDMFMIDVAGFLYFQGRKDSLIKSRGQKVNPLSVERFLYSCEGVVEAAVIGKPDPILGETIVAIISINTEQVVRTEVILEACRRHLSLAEVPSKVIIINKPLPKTPNGKIDKLSLKVMLSKNSNVE